MAVQPHLGLRQFHVDVTSVALAQRRLDGPEFGFVEVGDALHGRRWHGLVGQAAALGPDCAVPVSGRADPRA